MRFRRILFSFAISIFFVSCQSVEEKPAGPTEPVVNTQPTSNGATTAPPPSEKNFKAEGGQDGILVFEQLEFNLGTVKKGQTAKAVYHGKNIGDHSVVINNIIVSCACMKADYPKDPIHPGQVITITGYFDTTEMPIADYEKRFAVDVANEMYKPSLAMKVKVVN